MLGRSTLKAQQEDVDANSVLDKLGWAFLAMAGGAMTLLTTLIVDRAR